MIANVLQAVKKNLGLSNDYDEFDEDILLHINTAFGELNQIGLGPVDGVHVDETTEWNAITGGDARLNPVRTYVFLFVRLLFDPPSTGYLVTMYEKQLEQLIWRLNVVREYYKTAPVEEELVLDGGGP